MSPLEDYVTQVQYVKHPALSHMVDSSLILLLVLSQLTYKPPKTSFFCQICLLLCAQHRAELEDLIRG